MWANISAGQQRIRQAMAERPVAFFATLSTDLQHTGANQPIVFDRVVTNVGSAYNPHVGVFSASVSGMTSLFPFSTTPALLQITNCGRTMPSSAQSIYMHQMAVTMSRHHKLLCFNSPKVMTSLYAMCTAMKVSVATTIAHLLGFWCGKT